jgi:predicted RNA-binding protein YlxR (DUF448 family)
MVKNRGELLRFVLSPDGILSPDLLCKLPGRGAYTCPDKSCLTEAVSRKQFDRAFKKEVNLRSADELISIVASMMEDRIASYIALANKAGKIVSGSDMVMHILKKGDKKRIIMFSTDVSVDIRHKVINLAEKIGIEYFSLLDKERVGALIGKSLRSVVAVEGQGFVSSIKKELERYRNFVGGGAQ